MSTENFPAAWRAGEGQQGLFAGRGIRKQLTMPSFCVF